MAWANHWTNYTNNKSCILWSNEGTGDPPTGLAWTTPFYGKTGFTAISQRNEFEPAPGQCPVTALTPRHGYTRGHGMGFPGDSGGFNSAFNGSNVYFCAASGTLVTATVANGYTRYDTNNNYDYTILVFNADLPSTIQPMAVSYAPPTLVLGRVQHYATGLYEREQPAVSGSITLLVSRPRTECLSPVQ